MLVYFNFNFFYNFFSIPFVYEFLIFLICIFYIFFCAIVAQQTTKNLTLIFKFQIIFKNLILSLIFSIFIIFLFKINITTSTYFNGNIINSFSIIVFKFILLSLGLISFTQFFNFVYKFYDYWNDFKIYPLLFLGSFLFLLLVLSTYNLILTALCIFGMSICFHVLLLGYYSFGHTAREPIVKYFLFSAISTGFMLGGIKEFYLTCGTVNFNKLNSNFLFCILENINEIQNIYIIRYGIILLFCGFLFKLSAFPSHFWAPDVYEGTSFSLLTYIIIPTKFTISIILLKIIKYIFILPINNIHLNFFLLNEFDLILSIVIFFSIIFGGVNAMFEQRIKRFIAYSSINQIGFLLISFLGFNSSIFGIQAFFYFLITYVLNLSFFLICITWYLYKLNIFIQTNINQQENIQKFDLNYLSDFKYIFIYLQKSPNFFNHLKDISIFFWLSFILTVFSMAGIPPLLGFYGKFYLLLYAFSYNYWIIFIVGLIMSIVGAFYYLRILKITFFEKTSENFNFFSFEYITDYYVQLALKIWYEFELKNTFTIYEIKKINIISLLYCLIIINAWMFDSYIMQFTYYLAQAIILE